MRVLIACEFSGRVRDAFLARGHDAWSCDLEPTDVPGPHFQEDVLNVIRQGWDMMIAHPPCTYLCRAGWHWVNKPDSHTLPLKGEPRVQAALEAREFFLQLLHAPIPLIAVENPRPICHVGLPDSDQVIQPWQFGHGEVKETHLWLNGLPPLQPTQIVSGRKAVIHKMPPGRNRGKDRSLTYLGVAKAMVQQWEPAFQ